MGTPLIRVAGTVVLAAAALCVALLASDVHAWRSAVNKGDVVYVATPSRARWTSDATFGGAGERLLGLRDDIDFRRALQRYIDAGKLHLRLDNAVAVESERARAQ